MVNKHIDLMITDTKENIVKIINESKLPLTITSMILHEIIGIVDSKIPDTIEKLKQDYENDLKKENNKTE